MIDQTPVVLSSNQHSQNTHSTLGSACHHVSVHDHSQNTTHTHTHKHTHTHTHTHTLTRSVSMPTREQNKKNASVYSQETGNSKDQSGRSRRRLAGREDL